MFPHPYTIEDALKFIELQKGKDPPQVFAIVFLDTAVGAIRLAVDKKNKSLCGDIGYWLGEPYWNRGIATKVIKAVVNFGFNEYSFLNCISAYVFPTNFASKRTLEKLGFTLKRTIKNSIKKAGVKTDIQYYIINREDFE